MKSLTIIITCILVCSLGIGLGLSVANWITDRDYKEASNAIKSAIGLEADIYAVKRNSAEGSCSGRIYTFYSKGFEVVERKRSIGSEFSIITAHPKSIEFNNGCQHLSTTNDKLCSSILGAFLTIKVKNQYAFITGEETYLPIEGERHDDAFDDILALRNFRTKYHYVGIKPIFNPKTDREEYKESEPEMYQYRGRLGVATVESLYNTYQLIEDKEAIDDLNIILSIGGGFIGLLIVFMIFKLKSIRAKRVLQ